MATGSGSTCFSVPSVRGVCGTAFAAGRLERLAVSDVLLQPPQTRARAANNPVNGKRSGTQRSYRHSVRRCKWESEIGALQELTEDERTMPSCSLRPLPALTCHRPCISFPAFPAFLFDD